MAGAALGADCGAEPVRDSAYYRDQTARHLGVSREAVQLVRWEYEVDVEQPDRVSADVGFVPARACVPLRPAPDPWERQHARFAGLFELASFRSFADLDLAVAGDASSELTLFALRDPRRARFLAAALTQTARPSLADILQPGDIFVDLAVVHDLGTGAINYLTVKAPEATEEVDQLADHFSRASRRYLGQAREIPTFDLLGKVRPSQAHPQVSSIALGRALRAAPVLTRSLFFDSSHVRYAAGFTPVRSSWPAQHSVRGSSDLGSRR